jgi:GNAT superfamily N-acetyltransferase
VERWASPYLASQAEYLRHLGTAPAADVIEVGGLYAVRTGIVSNTENGVVSRGDVPVSEKVARETLAWMDERKLPASWLCAEGNSRAGTARVLERMGCEPERTAWETIGVIDRLNLRLCQLPDGVQVAEVASERELDAWSDVAARCGWFATGSERMAWRRLHLSLGMPPSGPHRLYVAFRSGAPVGMASAFFGRDSVLLTAVGVLEHERRRGIGRSLALTRLREARDRRCKVAVLAASPEGGRLYQALGFKAQAQPADRWFYLPTPPVLDELPS